MAVSFFFVTVSVGCHWLAAQSDRLTDFPFPAVIVHDILHQAL
jgi:hypothetical protein